MTQPIQALRPPVEAKDRVIIALDVPSEVDARRAVDELKGRVGAFKVGLQLFTAAGPGFVRELTAAGYKVFLDLKFHDIPNTVAAACVAAARLGVWMLNVHASGGAEMMRAASSQTKEMCFREGIAAPMIIGVTVLTSLDGKTLGETGVIDQPEDQVVRLARLAESAGLDGVVASPREAGLVKQNISRRGFCIVTPGIRAASGTKDDQKRVTTVREAFANGSDYVVIGRPVMGANDRAAALEALLGDVK
jgi:orotidine-5'-phosphate decarboxylase